MHEGLQRRHLVRLARLVDEHGVKGLLEPGLGLGLGWMARQDPARAVRGRSFGLAGKDLLAASCPATPWLPAEDLARTRKARERSHPHWHRRTCAPAEHLAPRGRERGEDELRRLLPLFPAHHHTHTPAEHLAPRGRERGEDELRRLLPLFPAHHHTHTPAEHLAPRGRERGEDELRRLHARQLQVLTHLQPFNHTTRHATGKAGKAECPPKGDAVRALVRAPQRSAEGRGQRPASQSGNAREC